ncbi:FAD-dependent oxidoreductase [Paraburkholderia strydomiana]|uniref:FAD-dependent oxidoreductase n=1 Tax=Paraburkholderia strydomiana TaxID=1245417 RepID=UPI0038B8EE28
MVTAKPEYALGTPSTSVQVESPYSTLVSRRHQMFPVLSASDIAHVRRFGVVQHFHRGEMLFRSGEVAAGMYILLTGRVETFSRDGLGRSRLFAQHHVGNFVAEIAQLSGKPALLDACATTDVDALVIPTERLPALIIAEAELGERLMRAMILRRVGLIEEGRGPILVGFPGDAKLVALEGFLRRNSYPNTVIDAGNDDEAIALLRSASVASHDLPLVLCPGGTLLRSPDTGQLASYLGLLPEFQATHVYDVAIVGAGPAGLATAVYAASEGLSVVMFDQRAPGGQAGTSARIENFFGFPTGISGHALAARAFDQALKFGVHVGIPVNVCALRREANMFMIDLDSGRRAASRCVVIASGASYRRPPIPGIESYEGRGVYYWASPIEAKLCRDEDVALVGGGNSAGQAVAYLAAHVNRVHLFIRGASLRSRMSQYLADRVASLENVEVHRACSIHELEGDESGLTAIGFRAGGESQRQRLSLRRLFLFVGADPKTDWLRLSGVGVDANGFIVTAASGARDLTIERSPALSLETDVPGVFAVGDVRAGSTKRVAAAVGDGALAVSQIHEYLCRTSQHPESINPC